MSASKEFATAVRSDLKGRVFVSLPFEPDTVWGSKQHHHVAGKINGMGVRGVIERIGDEDGLVLGPAWRRDCGVRAGDEVSVSLSPEGPQREDLAADVAAAFEAEPTAGEFFDSLAQFYRNAYLRWIDATKRRPDLRASRIAEMVELLKAGVKERHQAPRT